MYRSIFFLFLLTGFLFFAKPQENYLNEGLTENQVYNIRLYTTRALNLVLDAYSSLNKKRIIKKESYAYLDGSLFFLNEAYQYSPTYLIKREIEALIKRIKFYPEENYSTDIRVLIVHTEEISGLLNSYEIIRKELEDLREIAVKRNNETLQEKLEKIRGKINIPLIDNPISEARNLIVIAKDHLKAKEYKKSRQALELALTPLIKISSRENLYIALAKEYIVKANFTYKISPDMSKRYMSSAVYNINKAYLVSSEENQKVIKELKDKLNFYIKKYDSYSITNEDFEDIINLINKI
ncbi:hypothetical protein SAMN06265182_0107 [Persephonella hydrogeniphila]|uniref:YfdX protein n=1 Tax=Persephonella hydrogeniphila TaxID=198703 RepID=A0A285MYX2_9AQUI|nr:hypothetical protein [Persephonella hydrogeniphila]SNZ02385.1 hypothetical protein SAMN06265182_0107 [Persephonella hydrogeniphila]